MGRSQPPENKAETLGAIAAESEWVCYWGKALGSPAGGIWGAPQGGVGLLTKKGWREDG